MRSVKLLALASLVTLGCLAIGCAPQEEEDDTGDQTSNVTGGSTGVESPVVWLFDSADKTAAPKCSGALLGENVAVTLKSCAKEGQFLGRAADKNKVRAKVTKVIAPQGADAEIVVVKFDKEVGGTPARITHMPLKEGYSVNGISNKDGALPVIDPKTGEAASVKATMAEESATHGFVTPAKGSEICDGDLGAPVCSSTGMKIFNYEIYGTCGLSGLIVENARPAASGDQQQPQQPQQGGGCSANARKVVSLGKYASFLKEQAPEAFEPIKIDKPILRNFPIVPDGLWGYQTKGTVKTCKIETTTLDPVAPNAASGKLTAKVSFEQMSKRAVGWGRFGIAPKSDPKNMTWLPAKALSAARGAAAEVVFEGVVSAPKDGEYIVAFRASADGGENWTQCDTDGGEFSPDKAIGLKVGTGTSTPGQQPGQPAPQGDQPPPPSDTPPAGDDLGSGSGGDDPSTSTGEGEDEKPKKKKAKDDGGCSATGGMTSGGSALPVLGMLLGLAAIKRRRR